MFHSACKFFHNFFLLSFLDGPADLFDESHKRQSLNSFECIIEDMGVSLVGFAGKSRIGG